MGVTNISIKSPVGGKFDNHPALTGTNAQFNKAALAGLIADLSLMVLSGQSQAGVGNTDLEFQGSGTRASRTVTVGTVVNGNTLVVNGVTLTAATAPAGASQWAISATAGSNAACAAALLACINSPTAPAGILGVVRAYIDPATPTIVTIECIYPGTIGNTITLTQTGGTLTVSGTPLAGGAVGGIVRPMLP